MSQDEIENVPLTGKAKKAQRSAERHKKGKKSKTETTIAQDGGEKETESATTAATTSVADQIAAISAETTSKKSKKRKEREWEDGKDGAKSAETETLEPVTPAEGAAVGPSAAGTGEKKTKRRKKNKSTASSGPAAAADGATPAEGEGGEGDAAAAAAAPAKNQRFIVFIGNLPFTTTTDHITTHFKSINPTSIRHMTDKATKKSKGFAFLEFDNYDRMKTCLKLYHHSEFDTGVGGEKGKRRINVELTAGGGGKSENRKGKLKEKNERLEGQRQRRAEVLAKQEARKDKKSGGVGKDGVVGEDKKKKYGDRRPHEAVQEEVEGMHPARLAMMRH